MIKFKGLLDEFLNWRIRHIKEANFILILSVLVGIVTGLAGVFLKTAVHLTHQFFTERMDVDSGSLLFLVYPCIGIALTSLFVNWFVKDDIGHGVTKVLYAMSKQNSIIKSHNNYSSMVASTITIGLGGSVGTEATIVLTGASIGSNLARFFRMNYKIMTLMIGCGAAGAIAGIFKAPIAGIVFTLEVLMLDLTMTSLIPLMMSAMTSYVLAYFMLGDTLVFNFNTASHFSIVNVPYYILLGIFCGLVAVYFIRMNIKVETWVASIKNNYVRVLSGGALLGVLIYIFPPLYGEGYVTLENLINGNQDAILHNSYFFTFKDIPFVVVIYILCLVFIKVFATALTNGSGGVGGVFAPSLFTGGVAGYLVASLINMSGFVVVPTSYFVLAGMAGVMSGVMSSPLTAMFLIAEITGGYGILLPLMLTSVTSYLAVRGMEPHSIYARRLAQKGELLTHNKDKAVLTLMKLEKVIETEFKTININATLGDLVKEVAFSSRNVFAVIDSDGKFIALVHLDDIRKIMFNQDLYAKVFVRDIMITPPAVVELNENMASVMKKFEDTDAWNLPVVNEGKYIGFVSKSKIFNIYRRVLQHFSDE